MTNWKTEYGDTTKENKERDLQMSIGAESLSQHAMYCQPSCWSLWSCLTRVYGNVDATQDFVRDDKHASS